MCYWLASRSANQSRSSKSPLNFFPSLFSLSWRLARRYCATTVLLLTNIIISSSRLTKRKQKKRKENETKKRSFGRRRRRGPAGERGIIGTYPYQRASGRRCARTTRRLRRTRGAGGCLLPSWKGPVVGTGAGRRRSWAGRAGSGTRRTPRSRPRWRPRQRRRRRAGAGGGAAAVVWPAKARGTTSCCCCLRVTQAPRPAAPGTTRPRASRKVSACRGG